MTAQSVLPVGTASLMRMAIKLLDSGKLVVVPTETVYGIALRADSQQAMDSLYALKRRKLDAKLAYLVGSPDDLFKYCPEVPPKAIVLARKFWPGPLTLVLDIDGTTLGFRCPAFPFTLALAREADFPIFLTSANISGTETSSTVEQILAQHFNPEPGLIIDGGPSALNKSSTVVKIKGDSVMLMRTGSLAVSRIPFLEDR